MRIEERKKFVENNIKPVKEIIYAFNDGLNRIKSVIEVFEKEKLHAIDIDIGNSFEKLSFKNVEIKFIFKEDLFEELEQSDFNRLKKTIKSNFNINLKTVEDANELLADVL